MTTHGKPEGSNCITLSEAFFTEFGLPALQQHFPELADRTSAGLLGEGSEMLGFDDELSHDHDWGPRFVLFLDEDDYQKSGQAMTEKFAALRPDSFRGIDLSKTKPISVYTLDGFYEELTQLPLPPTSLDEWDTVRENDLCYAQAGKIFYDPRGNLTERHRAFQDAYYPRELWLGRIAAQLFWIWHYGEYNVCLRMAKRNEEVGALIGIGRVVQASMRLTFLLNRRFSPYWKWLHNAFAQLPYLTPELEPVLQQLATETTLKGRAQRINEICDLVRVGLHEKGVFPNADKRDYMGCFDILNGTIKDEKIQTMIMTTMKQEGHF